VWTALERARHEQRPTVLEIETYRYYGFTVADSNAKKYRTPEEIEERKKRDPLAGWRRHLQDEGILDHAAAEEMDLAAKAEAKEAVKFAEEGPPPGIEDIVKDVYWESDHDTPASRIGRHFFGE
jgi:pyruvate dehydrogenase E1 component alpha subunit